MNVLKTVKLHEPVGQMQFAVFGKLTTAYLRQIARESMLLLVIVYVKNASLKAARALLVICTRVTTLHTANQTRIVFSCILLEA